MIETQLFRKDVQADHWETFISKKLELVEEIKNIQGQDIADEMLMERRNWYQEVRRNGGKVPDSLDKYYAQLNDAGGAAEDEERKAAEDEENSKKKKQKAKELKAKGKAKKAGEEEEEVGTKLLKIGPTEVVQKFEDFYGDYSDVWANRDERDNRAQHFDRQMAIEEVMPQIRKDYQKDVDDLIRMELENLKLQNVGGKKKKAKGKKKKKKGRKGKKKANKLPGARYIRDWSEYDMLVDLVKNGVVKKLPAANLTDFLGEFNYIHSMMEDLNDKPREPSMALIR